MLNSLRRRLRETRGDDGVSLIELMVAMGLATIVSTVTLLVFTNANASLNATSDRVIGSASARNVLQSWQGLIQTADSAPITNSSGQATANCPTGLTAHRFEWLTSTETLFYADISNRNSSSTTCTPPSLVWLGLRNGVLLQVTYTVGVGSSSFTIAGCHTLTDPTTAKVTAGSLFSPNPGQVLFSVDYGAAFAASSAFASATSCTTMPTNVALSAIKNTDTTANNSLAQLTTVGIDFSVTDSTGQHSQAFDSTVAVLGGVSS